MLRCRNMRARYSSICSVFPEARWHLIVMVSKKWSGTFRTSRDGKYSLELFFGPGFELRWLRSYSVPDSLGLFHNFGGDSVVCESAPVCSLSSTGLTPSK